MFSNANLLIQIVVKESAEIIAGRQARRMGLSCSKDPNSSMAFRKGFLKTEEESYMVHDQLMHSFLSA